MTTLSPLITATTLYNFVQCPKRVHLDYCGDPSEKDPPNAFVEMLWERGTLYEKEVFGGGEREFLDLSHVGGEEKERLTLEAMQRGERLIYNGRITSGDLLGIPDLLRRQGSGYIPIDIKSGRGKEDGGDDADGKPKLHYAVQLALYVDILEQLGQSSGRRGYIFDVHANEIEYDLETSRGKRITKTLWEEYQGALNEARRIANGHHDPRGALASACKLCHWHSHCSRSLRESNDLTLIPGLGRAIRDSLAEEFPTIDDLAQCNPEAYISDGNTPFYRVGQTSLKKFHARARLLTEHDAKPYLKAPVILPSTELELFFDIEVDPLRDHTYLHGFVERRGGDNSTERFIAFFTEAETAGAERAAFARSIDYMTADASASIWYYSKYERTIYRKLQSQYPDVCSAELIEHLFDPAHSIDLYNDVVTKATEWPTNDHSIKSLAKHLGFEWRDTNPSGAASIQWFDEWVRTRNPAIRERILAYNEDDCRATRVLLDGIRRLS
ncbi:TM0106 family RecB-like putative nuclease [Altererythrobacter sp. GH1-8]|uniref:TM0106 family RecB-like putative nuclease n=1 Tax=Altererythrobacter sp. GH1-8 TaxID=3349333 RepID=UPI00374D4882